MKTPPKGVPAQQFKLRNTSGKDISFKGWKLAEVDNYNPNAVDKATNMVAGSSRWKERAVYQTEGGKVVCHRLGRSNVPGEVDRGEVHVIDKDATFIGKGMTVKTGVPREVDPEFFDRGVAKFFVGDALAKDLLDDLGIEDVEDIDGLARAPQGFVVDIENLPPLFPTSRHAPEFWTSLGRAIATFGFLEEKLARAIFALSGSRKAPTDEAMMGAVVQQWVATLEKALIDTLNPLIDTFGKLAREHPESRHENLDELLTMLREAAKLRNVICHGSWRPPSADGASVPFFVNRQLEVFNGAIDCKWLDQLQRHTAELCANVVSSVTHMGYQFPGSGGPGRPLT